MPCGYGRGPRRTIFSKLITWACCWRMECFNVDMWFRTATVIPKLERLKIYKMRSSNEPGSSKAREGLCARVECIEEAREDGL